MIDRLAFAILSTYSIFSTGFKLYQSIGLMWNSYVLMTPNFHYWAYRVIALYKPYTQELKIGRVECKQPLYIVYVHR